MFCMSLILHRDLLMPDRFLLTHLKIEVKAKGCEYNASIVILSVRGNRMNVIKHQKD